MSWRQNHVPFRLIEDWLISRCFRTVENLNKTGRFSDAFVVVTLNPAVDETRRQTLIVRGKNPEFNQQFRFNAFLPALGKRSLLLRVSCETIIIIITNTKKVVRRWTVHRNGIKTSPSGLLNSTVGFLRHAWQKGWLILCVMTPLFTQETCPFSELARDDVFSPLKLWTMRWWRCNKSLLVLFEKLLRRKYSNTLRLHV